MKWRSSATDYVDGGTSKIRDEAVLAALVALAGLYLAGRALLPLIGHDAVDAWRLAVGLPIFGLSALLLVRRAWAVPALRSGWLLLAVGVAVYPIGTILAAAYGTPQSAPPLAHAAWLSFYLCAYLALGALAHAALRPFPSAFLLDGVAVVLTIGSAATLAASIGGAAAYRVWEVAIGLSYPALDLVLLGYTLWIMAVSPRPVAQLWHRLAVALAVLLVTDLVFLGFGVAQDLSAVAFYTAGYPIVMLLLARAALTPAPELAPITLDTRTAIAMPLATVVGLLAVLAVAALEPVEGPTLVLVALAVAVLTARVVLIHRVVAQVAEARRFERGFEEAGIGMGITDLAGRWTRVNAALAEMLRRPASELIGHDAFEQVEGGHRTALRALRAQLAYGAGPVEPLHLRVGVPGDTRDLLVTGDLVADDDGEQCFVQVRDVTNERRARGHADAISSISRQALALDDLDELLARAMPLLRQATNADLVAWIPLDGAGEPTTAAPDPSIVDERVIEDLRAGGSVLLGSREGRPVEITDPRALELGLPHLARQGLTHVAFTAVHPRAAGRAALCIAHAQPPERVADERTFLDTVANVLATAADRAHDERASRHRALHDPLTGLANRALLSAHLSQAIAAGRRDGGNVGALLIDLDRFKLVNDTLGHEIGDGLLRAVSERLGRHTREGDLLARLGGDEFVLVVSRVGDPQEVERAAARIVAALEQPFDVGERELCVGASTGVAILPASVATPEALLREADLAMYRAKRGGGARWARADAAVRGRVEPRGDIARDLRDAVADDRLRLAFQPQLSLERQQLTSFEALVRWARPGHGVLHPDAFVPLAATIGLLGDIGDWVLARALAFVGGLPNDDGVARAAVNLLPMQLTAALPESIDRISAVCGVPASRLTLELPADTVVTDEGAMDVVERLRDRGIAIVLEGFGPGWTSLPALQRHAIDALKLDRSLIARLPDSAAARSVARSTVRIAEEFGIAVAAAGIETREQLDAVRELGVDLVQGHLLSPPIGPGDAAGYARARSWRSVTAG